MPWFTYHGLSADQVKRRLEAHAKQIRPPVTRGEEDNPYYPDKQDDPDKVDWKRKNYAAWIDEQKQEYLDGLEAEMKSAKFTWTPNRIGGVRRQPPKSELETIVFEAGVPLEVQSDHWLFEKLESMVKASKKSKEPRWTKSAKAPAAEKKEEPEAPKKRGRPKKTEE